jgi:hypothetical protein
VRVLSESCHTITVTWQNAGWALRVHLRSSTSRPARGSLMAFERPDLFGRGFDPLDDRSNVVGIYARPARKSSQPPPARDGTGLNLTC